MVPFFHGGVPGLVTGDVLQPGHRRKHHEGCPWCEARERGDAHLGMDGPAQVAGVYFTSSRLYGKFHASLFGRGDLYRVEPRGVVVLSVEDSIESFVAPEVVVAAVLDRAVLLTRGERRRLDREWKAADVAAGFVGAGPFGVHC